MGRYTNFPASACLPVCSPPAPKEVNPDNCHVDNIMMFRPETASSSNFLEDDSKHLRLSIEIQLNLVDHFGFGKVCWTNESQPRISGVGSCWGWDLARFDEDEDRIGTLSECIKFDKYIESMYMAGVEKVSRRGREDLPSAVNFRLTLKYVILPTRTETAEG